MKHRQLDDRTHVLVFAEGDEAMAGLTAFVREHGVTAGRVAGIGGFSEAEIGYFDWERKDYRRLPVAEHVEALSLTGTVALAEDGQAEVHAHVVLGRQDGSTLGGHFFSGRVRPTLEMMLTAFPSELHKRADEESGLELIEP